MVLDRDTPSQSQERLLAMLQAALGPLGGVLDDPRVIEIMLNPDGQVWVERLGTPPQQSGYKVDGEMAERIIRLVASSVGAACHAGHPTLSAILPGTGSRFQGFVPPVVRRPAFIIRQPAVEVFTLEDYCAKGIMSLNQAALLRAAAQARRNLVIAGGTGSGKTTLANTILALMAATGDRIITLEDTPELHCPAPNSLALYTVEGVVDMRHLVQATLRSRPDRLIIGEVRDGTALELLKAMISGHPGSLTTIHASSVPQTLTRLEQLVQEVVLTVPYALIADAVDVIVHIERDGGTRRLTAVTEVLGYQDGQYALRPLDAGAA